jgi:hypothetical protein
MTKPKKKTIKNPTDPMMLARSVVEAAIGEPLTRKKLRKKPLAARKPK